MRSSLPVALALSVAFSAAASARPVVTGSDSPAHLRRVPADAATLMILQDPAALARRVLGSPRVEDLLTKSALARLMQESKGKKADPKAWLAALESKIDKVPRELALGMSSTALANTARIAHVALLTQLLKSAVTQKDGAVAAQLRGDLARQLQASGLPGLLVWFRPRDPAQTDALFEQASKMMPGFLQTMGLEVQSKPDLVSAKGTVASVLKGRPLGPNLVQAGLATSPTEPGVDALAAALGRVELAISLEKVDGGVRLFLGSWASTDAPLAADDLGPLWKPDGEMALWLRWDFSGLDQELIACESTWNLWKDKPLGKSLAKADKEDAIGDLIRGARKMHASAPKGAARLDIGSGLAWLMREEGATAPTLLAGSPMTKWFPSNGQISADSRTSFGESISTRLSQVEDRMERKRLISSIKGGKSATQMEQLAQTYYRDLGEVRKLILDKAPEIFTPGVACVFSPSSGSLAATTIKVTGKGGKAGTVALKELPVPELAYVSRIKNDASFWKFADELTASLQKAAKSAKTPVVETSFTVQDLGLGVPTRVLRLGPSKAKKAQIDMEPVSLFHVIVIEDFAVLSTSPRLTKQMLAAFRGESGARGTITFPDGSSGYAIATGEQIRSLLSVPRQWAQSLAKGDGRIKLEGPAFAGLEPKHAESFLKGLDMVDEIVQHIGKAEWVRTHEKEITTTVMRLSPEATPAPTGK